MGANGGEDAVPDRGEIAKVALRVSSELMVMLYGSAFEQETDATDADSFAGELIPVSDRVMAARQEVSTVAETLIEALAVAAATGVIVEPDARMPKARIGNVAFKVTALPPARTNT